MKTLTINGQSKTFSDEDFPSTVSSLLTSLAVESATVVAELDGEIIDRQNFGAAKLSDGNKIELIRFMGGG